jgi:hypothetical protein
MSDDQTEASKPATTAEPLALRLNDQLGLAPAYLGNGHAAYAASVVAAWPEHNRARFGTLLFTGAQLEAATAAERERCAAVAEGVYAEWTGMGPVGQFIAGRIRKA